MDSKNRYTVLVQPDDPWQPEASNFTRVDCPYAQFSLNPMQQIHFARQLRSLKPDLVHFPMNQQPILFNGKRVTTTMDFTMLRFTRSGKSPLPVFWLKMAGYRFLFWWSNKKSEAIMTITDYVKHELEETYPFTRGRITTTHLAGELPIAEKAVQPKAVSQPFIMYIGTAFPHKNLENLIKAFEILNTSQPELKLVLAGKREYYYEQLEKLAEHSPARASVIFTGFVSDAELKWLYEHAEAYVFPSLSEGFGLPGLEAMAHGCPVVSSNATCLPEVYQDAALYFDPNSPEDMANKIQQVLDNPELSKELVAKGQKVLKQYSWEKTARETLAVYQKVLK